MSFGTAVIGDLSAIYRRVIGGGRFGSLYNLVGLEGNSVSCRA